MAHTLEASLALHADRCHATTNETSKDSDVSAWLFKPNSTACRYDRSMKSQTKDPQSRGLFLVSMGSRLQSYLVTGRSPNRRGWIRLSSFAF